MDPTDNDTGTKFQYQPARFTLGGGSKSTSAQPFKANLANAPLAPLPSPSAALFGKPSASGLKAFRSLTSQFASKFGGTPGGDSSKTPAATPSKPQQELKAPSTAPARLERQASAPTTTDASAPPTQPPTKLPSSADHPVDGDNANPPSTALESARPELEGTSEYISVPELEGAAPTHAVARVEDSLSSIERAGENPYWMRSCSQISSPMLRLHQEIVSLVELLHPTAAEAESRQAAVSQVEAVVKSIWPQAEVAVFGSFATGLYVPTSDVDLVVLNSDASDNIQSALRALANSLTRRGVAKGIQVIGRARVPIIKFETVEHGSLAFDVSFDVANGPEAAELVKEFVGEWPMMRPLILILKLFLQQRELNEVYTGGIGSYALITMVAAFMQLHSSRRTNTKAKQSSSHGQEVKAQLLEPSLGVLLVDFFRFYGRVVNTQEVGIACSSGGHFYSKRNKGGQDWSNAERPYMLSVEDPKDDTNDICRSSFNIMRVKSAFDFAYQVLTAPGMRPDESLLARVLRLGPMLASRRQPSNPLALYTPAKTPARPIDNGSSAKRKREKDSDEDNSGGGGGGDDEVDGGDDDELGLSSEEDEGEDDDSDDDDDDDDDVNDEEGEASPGSSRKKGGKRKQRQLGGGGKKSRQRQGGPSPSGEGSGGKGRQQLGRKKQKQQKSPRHSQGSSPHRSGQQCQQQGQKIPHRNQGGGGGSAGGGHLRW